MFIRPSRLDLRDKPVPDGLASRIRDREVGHRFPEEVGARAVAVGALCRAKRRARAGAIHFAAAD